MSTKGTGPGIPSNTRTEDGAIPVCPICGHDLTSFRTSGRLGCPIDYDVFVTTLTPIFETNQAALVHVGKWPSRGPSGFDRLKLQAEMRQAVERQDFESAALIRDRLRERTKLRES